jgi:hypothetical protein
MNDPYWKLRPLPETPPDEICSCAEEGPIAIRPRPTGSNPIACLKCNQGVPPEGIGFTEELSEAIAFYNQFYVAVYYLWLDSGEYEVWARQELQNPKGPVVTRGLKLVAELNHYRKTYLSWFQDYDGDDNLDGHSCPHCSATMSTIYQGERFEHLICDRCYIALYASQHY